MLQRYLIRLTAPAAVVALAALVGAGMWGIIKPTAAHDRYPTLWWSALTAAAVALVLTLALAYRMGPRLRLLLLTFSGLLAAVFSGNGFHEGVGQWLAGTAVALLLALAVAATVVVLEQAQHTPVRRL